MCANLSQAGGSTFCRECSLTGPLSFSAKDSLVSGRRATPTIVVSSLIDRSSMRLKSAGASLRAVRSPLAPKITITLASGRRRLVDGSPRISAMTDEWSPGGGIVAGRASLFDSFMTLFLAGGCVMSSAEKRRAPLERHAQAERASPGREAALGVETLEEADARKHRANLGRDAPPDDEAAAGHPAEREVRRFRGHRIGEHVEGPAP